MSVYNILLKSAGKVMDDIIRPIKIFYFIKKRRSRRLHQTTSSELYGLRQRCDNFATNRANMYKWRKPCKSHSILEEDKDDVRSKNCGKGMPMRAYKHRADRKDRNGPRKPPSLKRGKLGVRKNRVVISWS